MPGKLASLASGLFQEIVSNLILPDLAVLARTCKSLNDCLTPVIWDEIELHYRGTHDGFDIENEATSYRWESATDRKKRHRRPNTATYPFNSIVYEPSARRYAQAPRRIGRWERDFERTLRNHHGGAGRSVHYGASDNYNRRNFQFGREKLFIELKTHVSEERWTELAANVRSLCMSCGIEDRVLTVIASLPNLSSLELVGLPLESWIEPSSTTSFDGGGAPVFSGKVPTIRLPSLKNLRLRGYFPATVVREICSNAARLTHLDLGLLATPRDDEFFADTILGGDLEDAPVHSEQVESYLAMDYDSYEDAKTPAEKSSAGESKATNEEEDEEDDGNEDEDDEDEEEVYALHGPLWLSKKRCGQFTNLTHLQLVRPYSGECLPFYQDAFVQIPEAYEQVICREWEGLLRATASTLRELILEHRLPMERGDTVGDGDPWPEKKGYHGRLMFYRQTTEPDLGDVMFCRFVLRLLLTKSQQFAKLERLSLRGIQIKGMPTTKGDVGVPGKNGLHDNDEALRKAFPQCQLDLFEDVYPIHVYAGYVMQNWSNKRQEAMQDEGDGLMYGLAYFNDYKRRFGPQWVITS